MGRAGQ